MKRVDADSGRAEACGELDQTPQVAEIADAPVARRAHAIELHHEAPDAPACLQRGRFMAFAFRNLPVLGSSARPQGVKEPLARRRLDQALLAPDVEITLRNLGDYCS